LKPATRPYTVAVSGELVGNEICDFGSSRPRREAIMTSRPNLESLARQLCEAEGHDPDELVTVPPVDELTNDEQVAWRSGSGIASVTVPRWMTYRSHAERMAKPE
jgi:hypothetical protein